MACVLLMTVTLQTFPASLKELNEHPMVVGVRDGSRVQEAGRTADETPHQVRISRTYAVATTEVANAPLSTGESRLQHGAGVADVVDLADKASATGIHVADAPLAVEVEGPRMLGIDRA